MRSAHRNESLRRRVKSRHAPVHEDEASAPDDRPLTYRVYDLAALEARETAIREARQSMNSRGYRMSKLRYALRAVQYGYLNER
jgi:hypothetical protein